MNTVRNLTPAQQIIAAEVRRLCPGVECQPEHEFCPWRKWRLDLAWPSAMVGLEIHGSVFRQGRHTRGKGFLRDREKINTAQRMGWCVLEYSTDDVDREFGRVVDEVVEVIQKRNERKG